MFSENKKGRQVVETAGQPNRIGKGTNIVGDISSDADFRIDGALEGNVKTSGKVVIGRTGSIKGKVECLNADIEGKFSGELSVNDTLALKASANIQGDVVAGKLAVEPGATFNASCSMTGTSFKNASQSNGASAAKTVQQQTIAAKA
ncbi:polymer-forming cytoskeletal protein [Spongiivirga sp. MCCC 1A20706]|uniref:bactofilin family protein n=1 Tax=Spongiivirga sp. MCCC 1A20706 TaxID=3160963 RepID=UPI00397773CE